jgi:RRXRR protein
MSRVFVVDAKRRPLQPCTPARARLLLKQQKAAVLRHTPFMLILQERRTEAVIEPLRLKIDPGSKVTGLALVNDQRGEVVWAAELTHRSEQIRERLRKRRAVRRSRRTRHSRYRPARWANRRRAQGWLAPSLLSRVLEVMTWVQRLQRWCPLGELSQELVRFDPQALQDPEIHGIAYQR